MENVILTAPDGFRLAATFYGHGQGPIVLLAGATGVPQGFYRKFAEAFAARGTRTLTIDYRGLGRSKPEGDFANFHCSKLDWAEQDLSTALAWALERGPVVVIGHSFGGHAFGILKRANETKGLLTFGTGAGWAGYMSPLESAKARFFWTLLGPLLTRTKGYLPSSIIGLGEDLPAEVFRQWRRWCRQPRYFFDDPEFPHKERFKCVRRPILAINATDDAWAPPASARAFIENYGNAPRDYRTLTPSSVGARRIGHMGYFRPHIGLSLWPAAHDWVTQALTTEMICS